MATFPAAPNNYQVQVLENGGVRLQSYNDFTVIHLPTYTNATRPSAALYPPGYVIFNVSDEAPNYADQSGNWRDAMGNIT